MNRNVPRIGRRSILVGAAATAAIAPVARAQQQISAWGPEEEQAIALIRQWVAALLAKDIEKVISMTDDAIRYRDDPFQTEPKKGLDHLRADVEMLLRGLTGMEIRDIYAVGSGKNDVLVLARRIDRFDLFGRIVTLPIGAYYRVRNGKILEWFDTPLADMPPPPEGAPPPGGK